MYLMQMGEIPMLNRDNEVAAAVQIESTRRRFRRTMLCSDYMLHAAVDLLQKVADGTLRLDRTIEISVTNTTEKKRILKRIAPNLATARELLGLNQKDYRRAVSRRTTVAKSTFTGVGMIARRNKVIRLVEELNLRIQRLTPLMSQLHEISERMWSLKSQLAQAEQSFHHANEHELRHELRYLMRITQETPATLRRLTSRTLRRKEAYDAAKRDLSAAQSAAGRLDRQAISQPRHELPRPDPRRQHRPDAGGRQVRTCPRVQVQHLRHLVDSPGDHPGHRRPKPHDPRAGPHDRHDEQDSGGHAPTSSSCTAASRIRKRSRELAGLSVDDARCVLKMTRQPLSLDQPVGDHEDNYFGEFLEDHREEDPLYDMHQEALKARIEEVMTELNYREREILRLRYGLADGYTYTLEEVGKIFSVTRERVRQIESKAVRKLQSPYRSRALTGFLDGVEPMPMDVP